MANRILHELPTELLIRVCQELSLSDLGKLTRASRDWHHFIDVMHQDSIYRSIFARSAGQDVTSLDDDRSFARYYKGVQSWKERCHRQVLLINNWSHRPPFSTESLIRVQGNQVWEFRADFKNRFILATLKNGGLVVTDMDEGTTLWSLPDVSPCARLEYSRGIAVFSRPFNGFEVWKLDDTTRGHFYQVAVTDTGIRSFQLSSTTLCALSTEDQTYVYNLSPSLPQLWAKLPMPYYATGYLHQNDEVVVYSTGSSGYQIFSKSTGDFVGALDPNNVVQMFNIPAQPLAMAPQFPYADRFAADKPFPPVYPPAPSLYYADKWEKLNIWPGPRRSMFPYLAAPMLLEGTSLEEDKWLTCRITHKLFVGVSEKNRVFICSDWKEALKSPAAFKSTTALLELNVVDHKYTLHPEYDRPDYRWGLPDNGRPDLLSVRDNRIMLVNERVYVVTLGPDYLPRGGPDQPASFAKPLSPGVPDVMVSDIALQEDNLMYTYPARVKWGADDEIRVIRVLSLTPGIDGEMIPLYNLSNPRTFDNTDDN